jgi:hypothetical protein
VKYLLQKGASPNHPYESKAKLKKADIFECKYQIEHTKRTPLMHTAQHSDINYDDVIIKIWSKIKRFR